MNYEEFKSAIISRLEQLLEPDTSMQLKTICKNNGLKLDGLIISNKTSNVSPTIFLNHYYEKQEFFPDFDAICKDILLTYRQNCQNGRINADFFTDYSKIRNHIAYRLVHYEKNKELLSTVPHVRYLDLAIVFYCLLNFSESGNATILIHSSHLQLWKITPEELYEQACETTPVLLPYDFQNITSVISDLCSSPADFRQSCPAAAFHPMYVLTNSKKIYGASCILYPHLLESLAEKLDADLFLLPSSIHEMILLPAASHCYDPKELAAVVSEINQTELAIDEVLSSRIYHYSRTSQTLNICP